MYESPLLTELPTHIPGIYTVGGGRQIGKTTLLESMDALFVQHALLEDKLAPAPKKAKKLFFMDPFIIHALNLWLNEKPLSEKLSENEQALLVETCVVTHLRRFYTTYYIKAEGEVDAAYIHEGTFWPVEVKWTNQIRPKDLKQIQKYARGCITGKNKNQTSLHGLPYMSVPTFLYRLHP